MTSHVPGIVLRDDVVEGEEVVPSRADAHRLKRVLRLPAGASIRGITPHGTEVMLELRYAEHGRLRLRVLGSVSHRAQIRERTGGVTLAAALIKRMAHLDFVIEKGTELGVSAWWAVLTEHCADPGLLRSYAQRLARWRRLAETAAIQCGRTTVPEICGVLSWSHMLQKAHAYERRLVARPGAGTTLRTLGPDPAVETLLLVGPEGGLSAAELLALEGAGFLPVSLGSLVLRSETALLTAAVLLMSDVT